MVQYLKINASEQLAFEHINGKTPGILFLGGLSSDMFGTKASFLKSFCAQHNIMFTRFDYRGHGLSSGSFNAYCLGDWLHDAQTILQHISQNEVPHILIGSSMGGWLMLLLAKKMLHIQACIGIAIAPDFTEELILKHIQENVFDLNARFLSEAKQHLLLQQPFTLTMPLILFHGKQDKDVPWYLCQKLLNQLTAPFIQLNLIEKGDHRLSEADDLALLAKTITNILKI